MNLPFETFDVVSESTIGLGADAVAEIVADESGDALAAGQLASEDEEVDLTEMSAADGWIRPRWTWAPRRRSRWPPPNRRPGRGTRNPPGPTRARPRASTARRKSLRRKWTSALAWQASGRFMGGDFFEESGALAKPRRQRGGRRGTPAARSPEE